MELFLLIPEGKPPFIAIAFTQSGDAELVNCDIVKSPLLKRPCKIVIEIYFKDRINLTLICEDLITARFYPHVKTNGDKLTSWLFITRNAKSFKFAHINIRGDKIEIPYAKDSKKKFALDVKSIEVLGSEDIKENRIKVKPFSEREWDLPM
jgi:hypothetical protein